MKKIYISKLVSKRVFKSLLLVLFLLLYSFANAQTTIWEENFNNERDGSSRGIGVPRLNCNYDWWTNLPEPSQAMHVSSGILITHGPTAEGVEWQTCEIPIYAFSNVTVSIRTGSDNIPNSRDHNVQFNYEIDGVSNPSQSITLYSNFSTRTVVQSGLNGNVLKIRILVHIPTPLPFILDYWFDNIVVTGTCNNLIAYNTIGVGANCTDNNGVEIILDGSQSGVTYSLWKLFEFRPRAALVGTGSSISFGKYTLAGNYRVIASLSSCVAHMNGNCIIPESSPPPAGISVTGGGTFCDKTTIHAIGGLGGTIYFQGTTSGGTSTDRPSSSEIVSTSGTYYFRARSEAGCWGPEGSANVTISQTSVVGIATPTLSRIPSGQSITLTLTGAIGSIQWQQSVDGHTDWKNVIDGSGSTTETYTTPKIKATTYYRAMVISGNCPIGYSNSIQATRSNFKINLNTLH